MQFKEYSLQKQVTAYIRTQYPDVLFLSTGISAKLSEAQAYRNSQIQKRGFKTPDLIIFEPKGGYHGLFIELKVENPYKLNGELRTNKHIQDQAKTIKELQDLGYYATFKYQYDEIVKLIDWYLNLN